VTAICLLAAFVVLVTLGLRRQLFAVSQDEEFARVTGLPVRALNLLTAVTAAVTVTVAMRVVGLLLVSALMVVPVAAAQQLSRSFAATFAIAVAIGVTVTIGGTVTSYYQDVPPGATIVLLTIAAFVVLVTIGLRRQLFAVSQDEEFARVTGLPVRALNLLTAITAAVTVTVAMRVVGLLLVSALMVVPVAAAQQLSRSFAATFAIAVAIGVSVTIGGTVTSYYQDVPPGATIVLLTIGAFIALTALATPLARRRARAATAAQAAGDPAECVIPASREAADKAGV
jgi:ABC-type Mn2+/Zn2+ transport system permease subunit